MEAEEGTTSSFSARHGASAAAIDRPLALRREDTVRRRAALVAGQAAALAVAAPAAALAVLAEWATEAEAAAMVAAQDADNNQLACTTE